jgi:hypothetical protein
MDVDRDARHKFAITYQQPDKKHDYTSTGTSARGVRINCEKSQP